MMTDTFYIRRGIVVFCSVFVVSLFLILRLYSLSTGENKALEVLHGQYTRKNIVAQRSGFVYDTDGELLSHEENGTVMIVNPGVADNKNRVITYISDFSDYSFEEVFEMFRKNTPFTVKTDEFPDKTPPEGVYLYPSFKEADNSLCRHLLGTRNTDGEGVSGVFKSCADIIDSCSGSLSYKYAADAMGNLLTGDNFCVEDRLYSQNGGVVLTIDRDVQKKIDKICDGGMEMGAVMVVQIETGDIIAMSSRPLFDRDKVAEYFDSENGELLNRCFSLYTPGSVFKAVVAAAALEKDDKLYEFEYECTGECDVSGRNFRCHRADGHGKQTMKEAFANSCNTYFITLMQETGFEYILTLCNRMGLGEANAIDGFLVPGATMPDICKRYVDAYKANFAFGQGDLLLSPVDLVNIYTICSTGQRRDLTLIKGMCGNDGGDFTGFSKKESTRILSESTVLRMLEMMRFCVTDGTGRGAYIEELPTAGKTATAQSGQYKNSKEVLHRWFAGVFPAENPEYVIVVLCDGNGKNSKSPQRIFAECVQAVAEIYGD